MRFGGVTSLLRPVLRVIPSFQRPSRATPRSRRGHWHAQCGRHLAAHLLQGLPEAQLLRPCGLTGSIDSSISLLDQVEAINLWDNLWGNQLSGAIPAELFLCSKLYIDLYENALVGELPSTIGRCTNLKMPSAQKNRLSSPLPPSLAECKELERLD